jgi:hypothetical protein
MACSTVRLWPSSAVRLRRADGRYAAALALRLLDDLPPGRRPVEIDPRVVLICSAVGRRGSAPSRRRDWSFLSDHELHAVFGLHRQRSPHDGRRHDLNPGASNRVAPSTHGGQALDVARASAAARRAYCRDQIRVGSGQSPIHGLEEICRERLCSRGSVGLCRSGQFRRLLPRSQAETNRRRAGRPGRRGRSGVPRRVLPSSCTASAASGEQQEHGQHTSPSPPSHRPMVPRRRRNVRDHPTFGVPYRRSASSKALSPNSCQR